MSVTYPRSGLDTKGEILKRIGSFWSQQYQDPEFLETLFKAETYDYEQQYQLFLDALNSLSRQQIPVYQHQQWKPLVLKQSDLGGVDAAKILYGQLGLLYGGGARYGDLNLERRHLWPLSAEIVHIGVITNRITEPGATFIRGIDFEVYPGYLALAVDPFVDGRFSVRPIYDTAGNVVDNEVALWLFDVELDMEYLWNHVGYVVGRRYPSSEHTKTYLNAVWDQHSWGPTNMGLRKLVAGAVGVPLVGTDGETVARIFETEYLFVVTDKCVYRYQPGANATVAEGDVVNAGDTLTDVVTFHEMYGNDVDISPFEGISCNSDMLRDSYFGSLYFPNADMDLEYLGIDDDGYAEVRFPVSGFPLDVEQFWDTVHSRGKASGATLAHLLDTREAGNGEPQPQNLPATLNPMSVVTDIIGANFMFVRIRPALRDPESPGMHALGILRDTLPPHTGVIFYVEMEAETDVYAYTDIGTDSDVVFRYGITAPETVMTVEDPTGYTYVMVGGDFVLVDSAYVVIGSDTAGAGAHTYGHLRPTLRQVATDCVP